MQELKTIKDSAEAASDAEQFSRLLALLTEIGEDPIEGLAGYLVTEDPTYLPDDSDIKVLVRMIGRDKLLRLILARALHSAVPGEV